MDLKEIGINMRNWVYSAQDKDYWRAPVNAALNPLLFLVVSYKITFISILFSK